MRRPTLCLAALLAAAPAIAQNVPPGTAATSSAGAARPPLPADSLAIARRFATWIWTSQVDSLLAHSPAAERNPAHRGEMIDAITQMQARVGNEAALVEERWVRRNGSRQYWRIATFTDFTDEPVALRIVIAPNGEFLGVGLNPLSRVPPVDPEP